jgi:hypothetical protein
VSALGGTSLGPVTWGGILVALVIVALLVFIVRR